MSLSLSDCVSISLFMQSSASFFFLLRWSALSSQIATFRFFRFPNSSLSFLRLSFFPTTTHRLSFHPKLPPFFLPNHPFPLYPISSLTFGYLPLYSSPAPQYLHSLLSSSTKSRTLLPFFFLLHVALFHPPSTPNRSVFFHSLHRRRLTWSLSPLRSLSTRVDWRGSRLAMYGGSSSLNLFTRNEISRAPVFCKFVRSLERPNDAEKLPIFVASLRACICSGS